MWAVNMASGFDIDILSPCHMLESLGNEKGLLGLIFNKSQNKFQDPSKLRRLVVDLIDKENWSVMSADVKGDAYEGLLEKKAHRAKAGSNNLEDALEQFGEIAMAL
jgi:type I restriction-modification system DNA methylase subunit